VEVKVVRTLIGRYLVRNSWPRRVVTKNKRCSCGGSAWNPCVHIDAVRNYLLHGGDLAESFDGLMGFEESWGVCPVCGAEKKWAGSHMHPDMWRCAEDSSHYWRCLGEKGGVRAFMTGGRPTGIPGVDELGLAGKESGGRHP
jgi:hypothetical protein